MNTRRNEQRARWFVVSLRPRGGRLTQRPRYCRKHLCAHLLIERSSNVIGYSHQSCQSPRPNPTLLLAILESTLESRLPLPPGVREAHTPQTKVEAVKIFLGLLGDDVLGVDLSQVDPRKLARGEWDECVYVPTRPLWISTPKSLSVMSWTRGEGLPTLLPWSTPPPSIARGRSGAGTPVASMSTTRARAVGEDRNPNDGGAARILDMVQDRHGAVTSTGGLGSSSFMAYERGLLADLRVSI